MRIFKKGIIGLTGALVGILFFGFFAIAPLRTIKAVLLVAALGIGVLLFAGIAIVLFGGEDD